MNIIELEEKIVEAIDYAISEGWSIVKKLSNNASIKFREGKINPALTIFGAMYFGATKTKGNPNWNLSTKPFAHISIFFDISENQMVALESGWMNEYLNISSMNCVEFFNLGKKLAEKYLKDK